MLKLVSVIVTCHNLQAYIGEAITSVLQQDYAGDIEVLVVDDCSTDDSAQVISRYQNLRPTVRYMKTAENVGVLMATVLGLENTKGDLVFFLDGDDVWEPTKISKVAACFERCPSTSLVTHDLIYIDANGQKLEMTSRPSEVMSAADGDEQAKQIQDGILRHSDFVWLGSAYAIDRHVADASGFCAFARSLPHPFDTYQDWPLAYWAASQPDTGCAYVAEKLFRYRLHGRNHSGDASDVKKAIRNVRRTLYTMQAIDQMGDQLVVSENYKAHTRKKLRFYQYMSDLYAGLRWAALRGFLLSLPYMAHNWSLSVLFKEAIRFVVVQLMGLDRFVRMRSIKA